MMHLGMTVAFGMGYAMRERSYVKVVHVPYRTPRELLIIAAVVQSRSSSRCSNDREVSLMYGPKAT